MRNGRTLTAAALILALLPIASRADDQPPLPPDASIDQILDALHDRGQHLQSFTANVVHTETDNAMGTTTTRTGKVWYQAKGNGDARLHVVFDQKSVNEKPPHPDKVEYLLNNGVLNKRDYAAKVETDYQVAKPGEKLNLFQLGKGPFPLPIGQDRKSVHDAFNVSMVAPAKDDPADSIHLKLAPKPGTELARKFSEIDVWVDRKLAMPVRIETQGVENDNTDRQTDLKDLKINPLPPPIDGDFALPAIDSSQWNVSSDSLEK